MISLTVFIGFLIDVAVKLINYYRSLSLEVSGRYYSVFWILMGFVFIDFLVALVGGGDNDG